MVKLYQLCAAGSPREAVTLALQKLTKDKVNKALQLYERSESATIGTILGISDDGVFFTSVQDWTPEMKDAFADVSIIPWIYIHELLGNIPEGSTDDFLRSKAIKH